MTCPRMEVQLLRMLATGPPIPEWHSDFRKEACSNEIAFSLQRADAGPRTLWSWCHRRSRSFPCPRRRMGQEDYSDRESADPNQGHISAGRQLCFETHEFEFRPAHCAD